MSQIVVTFPGGARVDAVLGSHTVRTDQPKANGGADSAVTPFQLFLASTATCAGFYVLGFCKQRDLDTSGIQVIQRAEMDPETHMATRIVQEIHVPASFPEKYYSALIRAAEQCLVKKHLENPPQVVIETVVD